MLTVMISSTSLQAFSLPAHEAAPRRLRGSDAAVNGAVASPDRADGTRPGGGRTLPDLPPGRILPRGSLLDISV
jgi:hypothetical protein